MIRFLEQLFCPHKRASQVLRVHNGTLCTECLDCTKRSTGVVIAPERVS